MMSCPRVYRLHRTMPSYFSISRRPSGHIEVCVWRWVLTTEPKS